MLGEPAALLGVARSRVGDEPPEARRVIRLPQMAELVHNDVSRHFGRCEDEPPVERERAARGARSPASPLVADRDSSHADSQPWRFVPHQFVHECTSPVSALVFRHGLERESRLGCTSELAREPAFVLVEQRANCPLRGAQRDNDLGRPARRDHDASAPSPRGLPNLHLDQATSDGDEPHPSQATRRTGPPRATCGRRCTRCGRRSRTSWRARSRSPLRAIRWGCSPGRTPDQATRS